MISNTEAGGDEVELLSKVPNDRTIGNFRLMGLLNWDESRYWEVRNKLIDKGILEKGRGQGGSVSRVVQPVPMADETTSVVSTSVDEVAKPKESDLYEPIRNVLIGEWAKDARADDVFGEITAFQGSKVTGKWARPDITVAMVRTFPYVPGKHVDVIVFEVKPAWAVDVTAVYEAIAQRRAANRAYVTFVMNDPDQREDIMSDICAEARKFGVGVISATDPADFSTWTVHEDAVRTEPDPERMNEFLAVQVTQAFREKLMKWWK